MCRSRQARRRDHSAARSRERTACSIRSKSWIARKIRTGRTPKGAGMHRLRARLRDGHSFQHGLVGRDAVVFASCRLESIFRGTHRHSQPCRRLDAGGPLLRVVTDQIAHYAGLPRDSGCLAIGIRAGQRHPQAVQDQFTGFKVERMARRRAMQTAPPDRPAPGSVQKPMAR